MSSERWNTALSDPEGPRVIIERARARLAAGRCLVPECKRTPSTLILVEESRDSVRRIVMSAVCLMHADMFSEALDDLRHSGILEGHPDRAPLKREAPAVPAAPLPVGVPPSGSPSSEPIGEGPSLQNASYRTSAAVRADRQDRDPIPLDQVPAPWTDRVDEYQDGTRSGLRFHVRPEGSTCWAWR